MTLSGIACGLFLTAVTFSNNERLLTFYDAPPLPTSISESLPAPNDAVPWKGMVYPALDLAAATTKLRAEETSTTFQAFRDTSPTRFDSVRVPSNNPTEDERSYGVANVGEAEDWKFWGVYDGHAGWATSKVLRGYLTTYVAQALRQTRNEPGNLSPEAIDRAIKTGFLNLDNDIMNDGLAALKDTTSHAEAISRIAPARAGSCALLALFDPVSATLRVACTGDSRVVLGRLAPSPSSSSPQPQPPSSPKYTTHPLSVDQTGFNPLEVDRLTTLHPNEPTILDPTTGRLLGMAITRGFGDHRWKWPLEAIETCRSKFYGTAPRPGYATPPYMTAEPEITSMKVEKGDFLILASDGLWDHLSSEDAVECVRMWIERERNKSSTATGGALAAAALGSVTSSMQKIENDGGKDDGANGYDYNYKSTPEHFTVEDDNAATHLVRNAFGGTRRDLFCSVMSTQAPDSRNVRDDVTVQVVFFGDVLSKTE